MGAGKTSIGRALAELLRWSFIDLDEKIEYWMKMPIRDIFQRRGEPHFREIETRILLQVLEDVSVPTVIALGGGTFIQEANARLLGNAGARVVFLETPIEEMLQRCRGGTASSAENLRPLAADPDAFQTLYAQRLPDYRKADLTVSTAGKTADENAREITESLQFRAGKR